MDTNWTIRLGDVLNTRIIMISDGYHGNHAAVTLRIEILKNVHPGGIPKGCPIPLVYDSA